MNRYWYVDVDIKNGTDVPSKIFRFEKDARACYDNIQLTASVIYKSLSVSTDNGDITVESEG